MGPMRKWKRQSHAVTYTGHAPARAMFVCVDTFNIGRDLGWLNDRARPRFFRFGVADPPPHPPRYSQSFLLIPLMEPTEKPV